MPANAPLEENSVALHYLRIRECFSRVSRFPFSCLPRLRGWVPIFYLLYFAPLNMIRLLMRIGSDGQDLIHRRLKYVVVSQILGKEQIRDLRGYPEL